MRKSNQRKVRAAAKCASFDIQIEAVFTANGLSNEQISDIRRKLRQTLAGGIAKLPFAHVYPCEVKLR